MVLLIIRRIMIMNSLLLLADCAVLCCTVLCSYSFYAGGNTCFTRIQKQLFYPIFEYWGNNNEVSMNASINAGSNIIDFSSSSCSCKSNMTYKETKECGKLVAL
jgi:hypothetical protein